MRTIGWGDPTEALNSRMESGAGVWKIYFLREMTSELSPER